MKAAKDKKAPKYHVAADWSSIPEHVKGCTDKEKNMRGRTRHQMACPVRYEVKGTDVERDTQITS